MHILKLTKDTYIVQQILANGGPLNVAVSNYDLRIIPFEWRSKTNTSESFCFP